MKKTTLLLMAVLAMLSCSEQEPEKNGMKEITFNVSNFENTTRALSADGKDMTDLWIFDYVDGRRAQLVHQTSDDAGFGSPTVTLSYGTHTLHFVCSRGSGVSISGTAVEWASPNDTFGSTITFDVSDGSASSRSVVLQRIVTKLRLVIRDAVPEGLASISIAPVMWYHGWDFASQGATAATDDEMSVSVPASYHGTTNLPVTFTCLSPAEWSTDIRVIARDTDDDIIGSAVISGVPFLRNRVTEYSGNLFGSAGSFSISLNDTWEEPFVGEW